MFLHGTIRTVSEETRKTVRAGVRRVAEGIAAAHGATVDVDLEPGYPVTVNDADFTTAVTETARADISTRPIASRAKCSRSR